MSPVIMPNTINAILPYGIKMELSHVATLQLPGLTKKSKNIHIIPKMRTFPLIFLGILCDDEFIITIDQQYISFQNIRHKNI